MNDDYIKLVDAIKNTDPYSRDNDFTKLKTIRTDPVTKGNLLLISKQLELPYAKIARYTVRNLSDHIPALTYKKILNTQIIPNSDKNITSIRFWVNGELDRLIELRAKQLKTNQQHLINLILYLFIADYKQKRSTYLLNKQEV